MPLRPLALLVVWLWLGGCLPAVRGPGPWLRVESPHFRVVSNAAPDRARFVAGEFERMRAAFQVLLPRARVGEGPPVVILAAYDGDDLKALLPRFWERPGGARPPGIFVPGLGRTYVALRLDAGKAALRQLIHHEYAHRLVAENLGPVPLWLNEGIAELYGSAEFVRGEVRLGRAVGAHVALLRRRGLAPLELILGAARSSKLYTRADRVPLFYAQSWLLTHYLVLGDRGAHRPALYEYLALAEEGTEPVEAARQALGPLDALQQRLQRYLDRGEFPYVPAPVPEVPSLRTFPVRELSAAEAAAVRGDFHVRMGTLTEAKELLDRALELDPALGAAHESMGLLYLRQGRTAAARPWFERAAQLGAEGPLAYYYAAVLSLQAGRVPEPQLDRAEELLQRALELQPGFAPAYNALASIALARGDDLAQALRLARRAVELDPAGSPHRLVLAQVLAAMGRQAAARRSAQRALEAARTGAEQLAAQAFLDQLPDP